MQFFLQFISKSNIKSLFFDKKLRHFKLLSKVFLAGTSSLPKVILLYIFAVYVFIYHYTAWNFCFFCQRKAAEVRAKRAELKQIEDLGASLEGHLILDNRYTEHSTVGLAQQWDQLDQLGMRMQHNLEQQIQAR